MLNWLFFALVAAAVITAGFTGTMAAVTQAVGTSATTAVELAIGLVGQMTLWLGLMGIIREAGLTKALARALKPVMTRLFPDVPADHPAMGAMLMNLSANVLGLNNAATPFGLKAMAELDRLNARPGTATDAMALFLVINTSGLAVLPTTVMAVRAQLGARDVASIVGPSLLATALSTAAAIVVAKLLQRAWPTAASSSSSSSSLFAGSSSSAHERALETPADVAHRPTAALESRGAGEEATATPWPRRAAAAVAAALLTTALLWAAVTAVGQGAFHGQHALEAASSWILPMLVLGILALGFGRSVPIYETFVGAAKEGFQVSVVIIPYLVAMLVAIGMLRASGGLDALTRLLAPLTFAVGFPAEALPMALMRPLSGSGALAVMADTMKREGTESFVGYLVSLINGSSETTFYVLALYFGSVQIRAARHTLAACLVADALGLGIATAVAHLFYGPASLLATP